MWDWSKEFGREHNTVLSGIVALTLSGLVVGCQAPAPPTPTAAPPTPLAQPTTAAPPATGSGRVEVLNTANDAFARGDLSTASGLYERVVNTPPSGEPAAATSAINDFAYFRDMVTLLADGREDQAKAQLDALQKSDATTPLSRLASQLWDQYGMVGQLHGACAQLQPQIASQAGPTLTTLQSLGVRVDPQTLCTVPSGG